MKIKAPWFIGFQRSTFKAHRADSRLVQRVGVWRAETGNIRAPRGEALNYKSDQLSPAVDKGQYDRVVAGGVDDTRSEIWCQFVHNVFYLGG